MTLVWIPSFGLSCWQTAKNTGFQGSCLLQHVHLTSAISHLTFRHVISTSQHGPSLAPQSISQSVRITWARFSINRMVNGKLSGRMRRETSWTITTTFLLRWLPLALSWRESPSSTCWILSSHVLSCRWCPSWCSRCPLRQERKFPSTSASCCRTLCWCYWFLTSCRRMQTPFRYWVSSPNNTVETDQYYLLTVYLLENATLISMRHSISIVNLEGLFNKLILFILVGPLHHNNWITDNFSSNRFILSFYSNISNFEYGSNWWLPLLYHWGTQHTPS